MERNLKHLIIVIFSILLITAVAVGCSPDEEVPAESENTNETSVQLPAVSSGQSSEDSEDLEPLIPEESDTGEDVYPEPVSESQVDLEAYPQPKSESIKEVGAYPQPEIDTKAISAYPEPGAEDDQTGETISLKTEMSASAPDEFELASGKPQLVEFFAYWCPTCKSVAPIIHELEVEYFPDVGFVYLDIDDPANDEVKSELGYRYQPHFILLDSEGNIVDQWVGIVEEITLRSALDEISSN